MRRPVFPVAGPLLFALGLAGASMPALAQEHTTAIFMGYGVATCAEFAQEYQTSVSVETYYFNWAQGYMSGLNAMWAMAKMDIRDLNASPVSDEKAGLRDYCSTHPLDEFYVAVNTLYFGLPKIAPPAK